MKKLTRVELKRLSDYIDKLDTQIGLNAETIKDVRKRILIAYERAE